MAGHLPVPPVRYDLLARALDASAMPPQRVPPPAPCPPIEARPKRISVTEVDRLAADPYSFYARAILKLSALEDVDAEPGPAWKGTLIHAVLDGWAKQDGYAAGALVQRMRHALDGGAVHPVVRALWLPRLIEACAWVEDQVAANRAQGRMPIASEADGAAQCDGVEIYGRVDRLDAGADGLTIVDYKTGKAPSPKQVNEGFAFQLGLLGFIADQGGFDGLTGRTSGFEYWSFQREKQGFGKISSPAGARAGQIAPDEFVDVIITQFRAAAAKWLVGEAPFIAKIHPDYAYGDYDHLMRLEEWQGRNDAA